MTTIQAAAKDGLLLDSTVDNLEAWLQGGFLPAWASASINELVEQKAWVELNDRFYKLLAFGTGGMRGRTIGRITAASETGKVTAQGSPEHPAVGTNVLNDFNIIRATMGLYRYCYEFLQEEGVYTPPKLVIAYDVRHFSRYFCELAASTWTALGGYAMVFDGPRSTPQLSFTVREVKATAGIVITASHNPPHDNGFKVYFANGAQVVTPHAEGIIARVETIAWQEVAPYLAIDMSRVVTLSSALDTAYLDVLEDNVLDPEAIEVQRPKVVFTPIHGTGGVASIPLLQGYGVEVIEVEAQAQMDGRFPTVKSPNPENAEALQLAIEKAEAVGADLVLATDPDCDRMGMAVRDDAGKMVLFTGNMIGSVLAEYRVSKLKEMGVLPPAGSPRAALIKTFVTTPLQAAIAETHGLKLINTLTGFKWIGAKLDQYQRELESSMAHAEGIALDYDATDLSTRVELLLEYSTYYVFGGEESYGYLASDRVRDKDGNAAVIMVCELAAFLKQQGITFAKYLDGLYLKYGYHLETLLNIVFEGAAGAAKIKKIIESYRSEPPSELNGIAVSKFTDFGVAALEDADGAAIPKENFYFLELVNGYSYAVRGSGTEPKIKFYCFAREAVDSEQQLASVKAITQSNLNALKDAIELDARARAER